MEDSGFHSSDFLDLRESLIIPERSQGKEEIHIEMEEIKEETDDVHSLPQSSLRQNSPAKFRRAHSSVYNPDELQIVMPTQSVDRFEEMFNENTPARQSRERDRTANKTRSVIFQKSDDVCTPTLFHISNWISLQKQLKNEFSSIVNG